MSESASRRDRERHESIVETENKSESRCPSELPAGHNTPPSTAEVSTPRPYAIPLPMKGRDVGVRRFLEPAGHDRLRRALFLARREVVERVDVGHRAGGEGVGVCGL